MKTFKNILIVLGVVTLILLLCLLFLGIKVLGAVFGWILGFVAVVFVIGWLVYMVGKMRGRHSSPNHHGDSTAASDRSV